jgi:hypothetical protein
MPDCISASATLPSGSDLEITMNDVLAVEVRHARCNVRRVLEHQQSIEVPRLHIAHAAQQTGGGRPPLCWHHRQATCSACAQTLSHLCCCISSLSDPPRHSSWTRTRCQSSCSAGKQPCVGAVAGVCTKAAASRCQHLRALPGGVHQEATQFMSQWQPPFLSPTYLAWRWLVAHRHHC